MSRFAPLSSPELAPLWHVVHDRLSSGQPVRTVRVGPMDDAQRTALADLLGLARLPGPLATVSLATLDQILLESVGAATRDVVTALVGPLSDRAADRQRSAEEKTALWTWLAEHEVVRAQPVLSDWVSCVRKAGIRRSLEHTRSQLEQALRVLARLPAAGIPLPVLADEVLHDPHALDDDKPCSTMVLQALAAIYDVALSAGAPGRRALWERAGVAHDELSPTVLAAGLRPTGEAIGCQVLRACADAGHAATLTLAQVKATSLSGGLPGKVWVFENPSVLALALARFGRRCPPIVCTSGWPSSAAVLFLQKLAGAGCQLHYHGDFDGEGLRIAAHILASTGAAAWRMTAADYLAALVTTPEGPSVGRVTDAPWDAALAPAMRSRATTVSEERVANALLDDLHDRGTPTVGFSH